MTQTEWDRYVDSLVTQIREKRIVKQADLRAFLRDNGYSKAAREYVKGFSGDKKTKATQNISVAQTVRRMNKRLRAQTEYLRRREMEIDSGNTGQALRSVATLRNKLRKRLREISDPVEYRRTRRDLDRLTTINKRIRSASAADLPGVLKSSLNGIADIQFSQTVRSSMAAQVKAVAVTEKTRVVAENFLSRASDSVLIDIVLSPAHTVYDICDEAAKAGPYTKDSVPRLPLHPHCKCRYHNHSEKTEAMNRQRFGAKK